MVKRLLNNDEKHVTNNSLKNLNQEKKVQELKLKDLCLSIDRWLPNNFKRQYREIEKTRQLLYEKVYQTDLEIIRCSNKLSKVKDLQQERELLLSEIEQKEFMLYQGLLKNNLKEKLEKLKNHKQLVENNIRELDFNINNCIDQLENGVEVKEETKTEEIKNG